MSATIKNLANGQLASSKGTLYTASEVTAIAKSIILVNTNTSSETVNLYYKKSGGTSRRLIPQDTEIPSGYSLTFNLPVTMGSADIIEGDTTTASKVDYVISGVEIS